MKCSELNSFTQIQDESAIILVAISTAVSPSLFFTCLLAPFESNIDIISTWQYLVANDNKVSPYTPSNSKYGQRSVLLSFD